MTNKYITVDGIRKLNPEWRADSSHSQSQQHFQNRVTALPVVSYPSQKDLFASDEEIVVPPSYTQAVEQYNVISVEAELVLEAEVVGVEGGDDNSKTNNHGGLGQLAEIMAKYEVPGGMLSKLLGLQHYDAAEITVDDSGSMNAPTDARGHNGEHLTRWQEAKMRVLQMMELIAYVKAPTFDVRFLNRPKVLGLSRQPGESPRIFYERVQTMVEDEFRTAPSGTTPALERIRESLGRYQGQKCLRYFMGDGVPNGGAIACKQIEELLLHRPNPETNPFTFISCTNIDEDVEWMKDAEEVAPFCSEFDDYQDESREIVRDQGKAFPYSYGLHLVAQIVAAFNPHDLDAMDESVPFTKQTLEDLMGYQTSQPEYKYYFDSFLQAQRLLPLKPFQRSFVNKLNNLFPEFVSTSQAAHIPAVAEYKGQMKSNTQRARRLQQQQHEANCCVIF